MRRPGWTGQSRSRQASRTNRRSGTKRKCSLTVCSEPSWPMWCPGCKSDSPMVAVLHSGIVCARCNSEILADRPIGTPVRPKPRLAIDEGFGQLGGTGSGQLPGDTPLFRFDAAHPVTGGVPARLSAAQVSATPSRATPRRSASAVPGNSSRPFARPVPRLLAPATSDATPASATEVTLTRSLLVFFAGQFTIAGAWFASSFPAFATGVVLTLAGTGWLLRAVQRSGGNGGEESAPVTAPGRPPSRRQPGALSSGRRLN